MADRRRSSFFFSVKPFHPEVLKYTAKEDATYK